MRTVSAREAAQDFSKILQAAVDGEEILITRGGKAVARLVPVERPARSLEQLAEIERFLEHLREGVDLGPPVSWTRDELYER